MTPGAADREMDDGSAFARLWGVLGIAFRQLTDAKLRAALAVIGVAVAVVLVVLMAGLGYGMTQAGTDALTYIDQDLWASAGPLQLAPGTVGGVQNTLLDAHTRKREIESHPDVESAGAIAFQSVYISDNREEFRTVVGVGVTGNGSALGFNDGFPQGDVHYANGSYDGPRTKSIILNRKLADQLNVSVNDTVYIGGTLGGARGNEYRVVGISGRFSTFLGSPTAIVHLSELQEMTGTTGSDRASLIGIRLESGADPSTAEAELEEAHPGLEFRTQEAQFRSVFENQGPILASAVTLVTLAIAIGVGLVGNTLGLVVYQQRHELAALRAIGLRSRTLLGVVGSQGVVLASMGVLLALLVAVPAADAINRVVEQLVGFPNLIKLTPMIAGLGIVIGLGIGLLGAAIAGWRLATLNVKTQLTG